MTRTPTYAALSAVGVLLLSGCVAGEGSAVAADDAGSGDWSADTLTVDFATYNPLSLIIREQGWLEATLGPDVTVEWVQSAGSNKANELLRSGAVDVASTAGSAALLARANESPIHTIALYDQPEWSAIVVAADSDIDSVEDLAGRSVAATRGTDPYFFLLQSLEEHGVELADVEVQNLQHADGRVALENGSVDAWAGLDPIMADTEVNAGSRLVYRNVDFNTYGFLNATEDFLEESPDLAQVVVDAYEKAREWAAENPEETVEILAEVAGIEPAVAERVVLERTNLGIDAVPGDAQRAVLEVVGPIFVETGDVRTQAQIDKALEELIDDTWARQADATTITEAES
ncbi:aliphatic sulfonate ABC transporter substrate-binding protein [Georgenia satyanarayanai]|uniref:aliphatic sulfonate ABC transporter substrate-binding protein n=1 Tax=Georgenia satyanarayanai TaxID=860221 RepID=UPI00203A5AA6|nr:aliphatic sulfonate ABC transporter substrate-binding protein [Georgenia satyanarayanai]MCM3660386.1 aliphatic sulfonate ABC transporter substrate-binding protein [Georgenia satyanarayanai]